MNQIMVNRAEVERISRMAELALQLKPTADELLGKAQAKAPDWLRSEGKWYTRAGVSRRGAYAQAIVSHEGAVGAEYGGRRSPAHSMFRSSVR